MQQADFVPCLLLGWRPRLTKKKKYDMAESARVTDFGLPKNSLEHQTPTSCLGLVSVCPIELHGRSRPLADTVLA